MAYYPNNPNGQSTSANSAPVVIASDQTVPVSLPANILDAFNQVVIGERVNDVQCPFVGSGTLTTLLTPVYTGSGSGTWAGGQSTFSTGATNPSTVYAPSIGTLTYTPGAEVYVYFTGFFTLGGATGTFQRLGLTDRTNGLYVGMEAGAFAASYINNGTIITTSQSNFNVDTLTGAANSKFTRAGVPEAMIFTNQNVFRIRFGWLGSAPIIYEALSPDDQWVPFHIYRIPNNQSTPSIQSPNLPVAAWMNGLGANLSMGSSCWAAGTSSPFTQKGVSSGGYMPVQNAKDTGRTYVTFYLDNVAGVTTEALATMNINVGGTVTTGTTYTVPVNKILVLQAMTSTLKATSNTAINGRVRVRAGTTVSATAGIVMNSDLPDPGGSTSAGTGPTATYSVPDGIIIASGQQVGISQIISSTASQVSVLVTGFIY